tara:strand:+ start:424 stop:537 length:114 start_codon:yes stop_codon:yes gene_type:complete
MNMVQEFALNIVVLSVLCGVFIYGLSILMYDEEEENE